MTKHNNSFGLAECKHGALPQRFKFAVSKSGEVTGYGSIFGNVDFTGERVLPGAFRNSIAELQSQNRAPLMLWQHNSDEPIGRWIDFQEDSIGLYLVGEFNLNTNRGTEAYEHVRAGDVSGLSIGYRVIRSQPNGVVLDLLELELLETSIVSFPANPKARVSGVKCDSAIDVERLLRDGGLSRGAAKKLAAGGWPALSRDEPEDDPLNQISELLRRNATELVQLKERFS
jgi:HK97 family phage prohead protease